MSMLDHQKTTTEENLDSYDNAYNYGTMYYKYLKNNAHKEEKERAASTRRNQSRERGREEGIGREEEGEREERREEA
jgi:hypothetical protein